jgi:hypothetical protein
LTDPLLRLVLQRVNANTEAGRQLAAQVDQHGETLERQQEVQRVLLDEVRTHSDLLRQVLRKLERRDG